MKLCTCPFDTHGSNTILIPQVLEFKRGGCQEAGTEGEENQTYHQFGIRRLEVVARGGTGVLSSSRQAGTEVSLYAGIICIHRKDFFHCGSL